MVTWITQGKVEPSERQVIFSSDIHINIHTYIYRNLNDDKTRE